MATSRSPRPASSTGSHGAFDSTIATKGWYVRFAVDWPAPLPGKHCAMADIDITPAGPGEFEVQVRDGDRETSHRVTVPESFMDELELPEDDPERVVRASFEFLLEREPASSILPEFSLDEISRYFPEYREELPKRLS